MNSKKKQSKIKLYYFDYYGKGEPIRMALWRAGVDFENVWVTSI